MALSSRFAGFMVPASEAGEYLASPGPLAEVFLAHQGRLAHKWLHYLPAYETEFAAFRDGFVDPATGLRRPLRFLEIGVSHGGSLQIWHRFFDPATSIWGIDIDPNCAKVDDSGLNVRIGSQADPEFLRSVVGEMGGVDIVLDDGSHVAEHQQASFEVLFPLLSEGGLYVAEDLHTAYWPDFGGGYRRPESFIEIAKALIDDMNGAYHDQDPQLPFANAGRSVPRITFYDSMVFIAKQNRSRPVTVQQGTPSF